MKKSAWIIALIAMTISACTSQKQATSYVNDDVYSSTPKQEKAMPTPGQTADQGSQVITSPDKTAAQNPGSSTFESDYNDYSYSSRINRFNNKDTTIGYFDEAYSGTASDANQGGSDPNVSISFGIGAGYGGYYGPSYSYGMGWGYPYSYWGWDYGWGYPYYGGYYGWGWGYPYYYGGYYPWYNPCCYCYGYNEYYPYYSTNTYYGSRRSLYSSDGGTGTLNSRSTSVAAGTSYNRIQQGNISPANSRTLQPSARTSQPSARSTPANQEKYRYTSPANTRQTGYQQGAKPRTTQVQNQTARQQPAPRYTKPGDVGSSNRSGSSQSYSSPVYRQPKSSQEYLAPRSQNPGTTSSTGQNATVRSGSGSSNTGTRQTTSPGNTHRTYTTPVRSGSSGYSTPARSNSNNGTPSRSGNSGSYSAPTRSSSSGSYSPPSNSNSGGSYSAPARSGGSSGGSSGGGSSSGGGGRRR
jgi:hypothetical protein